MFGARLFKIESCRDYFRTMTMLGAMCISRNLGTISLSKNDHDGLLSKSNPLYIGKDDYSAKPMILLAMRIEILRYSDQSR